MTPKLDLDLPTGTCPDAHINVVIISCRFWSTPLACNLFLAQSFSRGQNTFLTTYINDTLLQVLKKIHHHANIGNLLSNSEAYFCSFHIGVGN